MGKIRGRQKRMEETNRGIQSKKTTKKKKEKKRKPQVLLKT